MSNKINKHYRINKAILDEIQKKSGDKFGTEVSAIEYYLERGLCFEYIDSIESNYNKSLEKFMKELSYIKKLLEQLFSNKNFASNRSILKDEALLDFKKNLNNDKFVD